MKLTYQQLLENKKNCREGLSFFLNMLNDIHFNEETLPKDTTDLITETVEFDYTLDFQIFLIQSEVRRWAAWLQHIKIIPNLPMSGLDLTSLNLSRASLCYANFNNSVLKNTNLSKSSLWGASLIGVDLTKANLKRSNLCFADFSDAILKDADLTGANLTKTDLSTVTLAGATYDKFTRWPKDFIIPKNTVYI